VDPSDRCAKADLRRIGRKLDAGRRLVVAGTPSSRLTPTAATRFAESIGVAFGPDDADEAESSLKTADAAMYRVKQAAKRTVGQADCLSASAG
jgi:GGDEF domain-containing protein